MERMRLESSAAIGPHCLSVGSELGLRIIGSSPALDGVVKQVERVAPTDSAVLIEGETGTGKELIARAIHSLSSRRNAPFIKLNCPAMPARQLESELFGYEGGVSMGAPCSQVGLLELADKGTLFLDEIGELPLELQHKLVRVLQDHEFERLGSATTVRIDVRILAATNQSLAQMVRDRCFRPDLYSRLNVFPISLPPLRARTEEIPALVDYFVGKFSRRLNKPIDNIPPEAMRMLQLYNWPGNIRQLETFVERAVVMSWRPALRPLLTELKHLPNDTSLKTSRTPAEAERELRTPGRVQEVPYDWRSTACSFKPPLGGAEPNDSQLSASRGAQTGSTRQRHGFAKAVGQSTAAVLKVGSARRPHSAR